MLTKDAPSLTPRPTLTARYAWVFVSGLTAGAGLGLALTLHAMAQRDDAIATRDQAVSALQDTTDCAQAAEEIREMWWEYEQKRVKERQEALRQAMNGL